MNYDTNATYKALLAYLRPRKVGSDRTKRLRKKKYKYLCHGNLFQARLTYRVLTGLPPF